MACQCLSFLTCKTGTGIVPAKPMGSSQEPVDGEPGECLPGVTSLCSLGLSLLLGWQVLLGQASLPWADKDTRGRGPSLHRPSINALSPSHQRSVRGKRRNHPKTGFYATKKNKTAKERGTRPWGNAGIKCDGKSILNADKRLIPIYETSGDEHAKDLSGERRHAK